MTGIEWSTKKYNRGWNQLFLLTEADGVTIKEVSGCTVTLAAWEKGSDTLVLSGACVYSPTVISAATNCVHYTVASGVLIKPGTYDFDLEVITSGARTRCAFEL